jgi:hypothetical protein
LHRVLAMGSIFYSHYCVRRVRRQTDPDPSGTIVVVFR